MEYVITDEKEKVFVKMNKNGGVEKTPVLKKATVFTYSKAKKTMNFAPGKLRAFHIAPLELVINNGEETEDPSEKKNLKRHSISSELKTKIYLEQKGLCAYCGRYFVLSEMTVDHIVPLAFGGTYDESNLQCACFKCNNFKSDMSETEFLDYIRKIAVKKNIFSNYQPEVVEKEVIKTVFTDPPREGFLKDFRKLVKSYL